MFRICISNLSSSLSTPLWSSCLPSPFPSCSRSGAHLFAAAPVQLHKPTKQSLLTSKTPIVFSLFSTTNSSLCHPTTDNNRGVTGIVGTRKTQDAPSASSRHRAGATNSLQAWGWSCSWPSNRKKRARDSNPTSNLIIKTDYMHRCTSKASTK